MAGIYSVDIHGEASASPEGHIVVDFLTGSTSGSPISADLNHAIRRFSELLPDLAEKHCYQLGSALTQSRVRITR